MRSKQVAATRRETIVGMLILLALASLAAWVLIAQSRFDASVIAPAPVKGLPSAPAASDSASGLTLQDFLGNDMRPLSPVESFGSETLSEKIDGKAELYLSAGFRQLLCQRFVKIGANDSWMEVFDYDMGSMRNAFSVFSSQRRADAEDDSLTRFAYHSQNALFFVHGQDYVEIVASNDAMLPQMLAYGKKLVSTRPARGEGEVSEMALFPRQGLDQGSISLLASDVFGFEGLDQVFIATYRVDGSQMTAFLSRRKDEAEAEALASRYVRFLLENGGAAQESSHPAQGVKLISILDSYEVVFHRGRYLAGVHEADNGDLALRLAAELNQALGGISP